MNAQSSKALSISPPPSEWPCRVQQPASHARDSESDAPPFVCRHLGVGSALPLPGLCVGVAPKGFDERLRFGVYSLSPITPTPRLHCSLFSSEAIIGPEDRHKQEEPRVPEVERAGQKNVAAPKGTGGAQRFSDYRSVSELTTGRYVELEAFQPKRPRNHRGAGPNLAKRGACAVPCRQRGRGRLGLCPAAGTPPGQPSSPAQRQSLSQKCCQPVDKASRRGILAEAWVALTHSAETGRRAGRRERHFLSDGSGSSIRRSQAADSPIHEQRAPEAR